MVNLNKPGLSINTQKEYFSLSPTKKNNMVQPTTFLNINEKNQHFYNDKHSLNSFIQYNSHNNYSNFSNGIKNKKDSNSNYFTKHFKKSLILD
jgi:hypothetical protein